jgi:hypothetical protein
MSREIRPGESLEWLVKSRYKVASRQRLRHGMHCPLEEYKVLLALAREALEAKKRRCTNCAYCADQACMTTGKFYGTCMRIQPGPTVFEQDFCSYWEARLSDE